MFSRSKFIMYDGWHPEEDDFIKLIRLRKNILEDESRKMLLTVWYAKKLELFVIEQKKKVDIYADPFKQSQFEWQTDFAHFIANNYQIEQIENTVLKDNFALDNNKLRVKVNFPLKIKNLKFFFNYSIKIPESINKIALQRFLSYRKELLIRDNLSEEIDEIIRILLTMAKEAQKEKVSYSIQHGYLMISSINIEKPVLLSQLINEIIGNNENHILYRFLKYREELLLRKTTVAEIQYFASFLEDMTPEEQNKQVNIAISGGYKSLIKPKSENTHSCLSIKNITFQEKEQKRHLIQRTLVEFDIPAHVNKIELMRYLDARFNCSNKVATNDQVQEYIKALSLMTPNEQLQQISSAIAAGYRKIYLPKRKNETYTISDKSFNKYKYRLFTPEKILQVNIKSIDYIAYHRWIVYKIEQNRRELSCNELFSILEEFLKIPKNSQLDAIIFSVASTYKAIYQRSTSENKISLNNAFYDNNFNI